jgi:hypothetical protein
LTDSALNKVLDAIAEAAKAELGAERI